MTLEVLLANPALLARDGFRWWKYNYSALGDDTFQSPEPLGFDSAYETMQPGAYLHWTLPRSLRSGAEGSSSEFPLVPNRWLIVRIYRNASGNNVQKAWVLESDCPNSIATGSSYYLVSDAVVAAWKNSQEPNRKTAQSNPISTKTATNSNTVNIGLAFDLSNWSEKAANNSFLTAVAPGNIEFSAYVPFNEGIFSFYDDLTDASTNTSLSYMVTGWYADPTADIIATGPTGFTGGTTISSVLTALNWTIAANATIDSPDQTLYTGSAFGLNWNSAAIAAPSPDQLEETRSAKNMTVAIANTGVDAFSTLIGNQLSLIPGYTDTSKVIELLRAFQYDLLPMLNNINGDALLAERVRQEWFSSKYGGTRWTIVAEKPADNTSPANSIVLTPAEQTWLLQLNINQQALDDAIEVLCSLQWDLNSVWWKENYMSALAQQMIPNNTGIKATDLLPFLDPSNPDGSLAQVLAQLTLINSLMTNVPQPIYAEGINDQDAFLNGVTAFSNQKGINAGNILKAVAQPRFWKPNNPNVLISGVEPSDITNPDASLTLRVSSQIITSFTITGTTVNAAALGSIIPPLNNSAVLPASVISLYEEFFLLDPSNATQIATKTGIDITTLTQGMSTHASSIYNQGILPAISLDTWIQQWNPLYLEWQVIHTPVPFEYIADPTNGTRTRNWTFNGTDYDLKPGIEGTGAAETLSGRSLLSPHTQITFGARLKSFIDQYGGTQQDLENLYNEIEQVDSWRFLSQELVNFNDYLSQRDPRTFRKPTGESFINAGKTIPFSKAIGYPDNPSLPPYDTPSYAQGLINSVPAVKMSGPSDFPFHGIRSGQFYFSHLVVYDKFGRRLDFIDPLGSGLHDAANFPLVRDAAVTVNTNLTTNIAAPFQLPPRILQPSKLDILLIDQNDNKKILGLANNVNPVCGWIISNHLDQSLLLFLPDGTNAGEVQLIQGITGAPLAQWTPPPHNLINTIANITAISTELGAFVNAITGKTQTEFQTLINVIDSTLWTTDPLGNRTDINLSVLIGRPLALVKVQLQFVLNGPAFESCEWPAPVGTPTPNPNIPDYTTSKFSIRFGDLASREDGVIGYFEKGNYTVFNSVSSPQADQTFVQEIGPLAGIDGNYINLPYDGNTKEIITLLVDPRASIHATTGILPVKELRIPEQFINGALAAMEITFKTGPLLSRVLPASTAGGANPIYANTIDFLPVTEKNGTWSWWENTITNPGTAQARNNWQGFGINNATTNATLNDSPATIHEGYLQFISNLNPDH